MVLPNLLALVGFLTIFREPPPPTWTPKRSLDEDLQEAHSIFVVEGGWWCARLGRIILVVSMLALHGDPGRALTTAPACDSIRHDGRALTPARGGRCLFCLFCTVFMFAVIETATTPILDDNLGT
jgi:hypothetical protein